MPTLFGYLRPMDLVKPHLTYKESYLQGYRELMNEGWSWHSAELFEDMQLDFGAHVRRLLDLPNRRTAKLVPETELWAVKGNTYVGRLSIRHELNAALRVEGGHIGYEVVPSQRRRGYAREMLKQALPVARRLGLREVLLTCNDTNLPSIRVIEQNGGRLAETREIRADLPLKRYYWISL